MTISFESLMKDAATEIVDRATSAEDVLDIISGMMTDIKRTIQREHPEWHKAAKAIHQIDRVLIDSID